MKEVKKVTKLEKERRLFIVQGWIIEGIQDRLIVKNIINQWGLDVRQAQRYVRDAYDSWKKIEGVNIEMKRELAIARLKHKARSLKSEFKGTPAGIAIEVAIEKEINKLEGIEVPKTSTIKLEVPQVQAVKFNVIYGKGDNS